MALDLDAVARRPFRGLSGGTKQKVLLALALASGPALAILDEPTASLDAGARRRFLDLAPEAFGGATVVLCSHRLDELRTLVDHVVVLADGQLAWSGPADRYLAEHVAAVIEVRVADGDDGLAPPPRLRPRRLRLVGPRGRARREADAGPARARGPGRRGSATSPCATPSGSRRRRTGPTPVREEAAMPREPSRLAPRALAARAVAVAALAVGAVALLGACHRTVPDAPVAIDYDQEACAHCRMLIGDPRYAAQLVTTGGDVLDFDDPGCLMTYVARHHPAVHRLWFRDARADRWLAADEVGFVPGATTPMGFGLAAVPRATPGALTLAQAEAAVARHPEVHP